MNDYEEVLDWLLRLRANALKADPNEHKLADRCDQTRLLIVMMQHKIDELEGRIANALL